MQGRCVNPGATLALELNRVYYLFENGPNHYYVSRFNNKGAHLGCYQAVYFELIEEQPPAIELLNALSPVMLDEDFKKLKEHMLWPPEPAAAPSNLEPGKPYLARLIWRRPGYKQTALQQYYIRAGKTHAYFYKDPQLTQCGGCFPQHWFTDFVEIQEPEPIKSVHETAETVQEPEPIELFESKNGQLSFF